ncbi:MAG: DUF4159 domain-containing protein [Polyangiaceae bacterium]|nr:DUF4159 domain-containing protein [Polyangiaceae bacterium]
MLPRSAHAFGEEGAFNPRILLTGDAKWEGVRARAPGRWADELARRTSAPSRVQPTIVHADEKELLAEPFVIWGGAAEAPALTSKEIGVLKQFFSLGGILFVDDFSPDTGVFGKSARREIARVLPENSPLSVGTEHVLFRSFYLLKRAAGRVQGPTKLDVVVRAGAVQVIYTSHDVLGALAIDSAGVNSLDVSPGGEAQRELAIRLCVNVAMYVLCSNYKDDQVHAEHIMRRRGGK